MAIRAPPTSRISASRSTLMTATEGDLTCLACVSVGEGRWRNWAVVLVKPRLRPFMVVVMC
eukprot:4619722-Pyramimonas_sp.AAC.1